ncbi:MAG: TonB-dependent receptor, partial [Gemmatimonadetes bacterium]|nr:TonB-dependent receptor [Gemmatimonadota bacterium]
ALAGGGSRDAQQGELGLSGGSGERGFSLFASRQASNGDLAFNDRFATDVLSAAAHSSIGARTRVALTARWSEADFHYPTSNDGRVVDHNAEQAEHRFVASADVEHRFTDRVIAHLTLTQDEFLPRSNNAPDGPADTVGFFGYFSRSTRVRRAAELRLTAQLAARATLSVGAETARERESTSSLSLSQYGDYPGTFEASRHTDALYAQLLGDASSRLSYVAGARVDRNSAFGTFGTARGGLAWLGGPAWRLRASAGNAFKAPSFYENFASGYVTGNPALRPERSEGAEAGADAFLFDGALVLKGTVYAQRFRDLIQYNDSPPATGDPNYFNVAGA